jgi:hypothetical protein
MVKTAALAAVLDIHQADQSEVQEQVILLQLHHRKVILVVPPLEAIEVWAAAVAQAPLVEMDQVARKALVALVQPIHIQDHQ